jgi:deoxyribonuclease V
MRIQKLHAWTRDPRASIALQQELAGRILLAPAAADASFRRIAGVDVSFERGGKVLWAAVVVVEIPAFRIVEAAYARAAADFPYIPGLLSFRELPVVLQAFRRIRNRPDAVICDGQGLAHPRFFGLACHLGLWLDLPAVGCAKTRLVGEYREPAQTPGAWTELTFQDRIVGAVLRSRKGSKPVYVSPGHRITLEQAVELVRACIVKSRLPEPTRLAHLEVNRYRRRAPVL